MTPIARLPAGVLNAGNSTTVTNGDRKATTVNFAAVDPKLTAGYDPSKAPATIPGMPTAPAGVLGATYTPAMAKTIRAEGTGYSAVKNVVGDKSSSAYQLGQITSSGSPLMQQAETEGLRFANRRGLLNTSIAAGSVQDAMMARATPLATQDANTYATSDLANTTAENQARAFTANAGNAASLQNAQAGTQVELSNAGAVNQKGALDSSNVNSQTLADKQISSAEKLAKIQADTTMTVEQKRIASAELMADNENKSKIALQQMANTTQERLAAMQASTTLTVADKDRATKLELQNIQSNTALTAEDKRAASNIAIAAGDNNTKMLLQASANAANLGIAELDVDTKMKIAAIDTVSKEKLARLGIESDQLIRTNASAAGLMQQAMVGLAQISSSTMDAGAKQAATDNMITTLKNSLDAIGSYGSFDLAKFFPVASGSVNGYPVTGATGTGTGGSGFGTAGGAGSGLPGGVPLPNIGTPAFTQ